MLVKNAIPAFGMPLRNADYYTMVDEVITALRPHSTLRSIAARLNEQQFETPSGLIWNRERVSQYIRHRGIKSTTN
ncbi:hypothetical protein ACEN88_12520 [Massilia sp. CT11-108]|uniref:hypothetical protein n=1 Tax=Massilia sp. CT11-108 TaxID=3393900 RepID=UPI0039A5EB26